ncbi:hypothetical protein ERJ75_000449200 [Trypanosoma vivax]|nr:hypothetical protein ERJ75_000449200 [Trypanosoma vivax]
MLSVRGAVEKVERGAAHSGGQRGDSAGAGGAHSVYVDLGTEDGTGQAKERVGGRQQMRLVAWLGVAGLEALAKWKKGKARERLK